MNDKGLFELDNGSDPDALITHGKIQYARMPGGFDPLKRPGVGQDDETVYEYVNGRLLYKRPDGAPARPKGAPPAGMTPEATMYLKQVKEAQAALDTLD